MKSMEGAEPNVAPGRASPAAEQPAWSPERQHRLLWWKEALIVAAFYAVYSWTRNLFGSNKIAADGIPDQAFTNAERVIQFERWLGLFHEETVQDWFLPYRTFIQFWNIYYGVLHFAVTLGVFILLYVKRADVFPQWRNTLAAMTSLAIVGFAWFPLMPPRLLDKPCPAVDPSQYGGACIPSRFRGPGDSVSSTRSLSTAGRGRSTLTRWRRSRISMRRCRACTSGGRHGAPLQSGRC